MTDNDFARTARAWLEDGPTRMSSAAVMATLDHIHRTRQRRLPWAPRRNTRMYFTRIAAAAAAIVVAAAVGINVAGPGPGVGGPVNTPVPTPTTRPSPASPPPQPIGVLQAGEYALYDAPSDPVRTVMTVPDGWTSDRGWVIFKYDGEPPEGMAIAIWDDANVYRDGCNWEGSLFSPPVGPTVDDLATALSSLSDRAATPAVDVALGGLPAKRLEITIPEDVDFSECDGGEFRSWTSPGGGARYHQGPGEHSTIWIVEAHGTRLLIFARDFPATSDEDRAEARAIVESARFEPMR